MLGGDGLSKVVGGNAPSGIVANKVPLPLQGWVGCHEVVEEHRGSVVGKGLMILGVNEIGETFDVGRVAISLFSGMCHTTKGSRF